MATNESNEYPESTESTHNLQRPYPLATLLAAVDGKEKALEQLARPLTPKERQVLKSFKLTPRLRWMLERRQMTTGGLPLRALRRARAAKRERWGNDLSEPGAPAGPGFNWTPVGPRNINGRIKCLAIHPTNPQILYAGAAEGGVWKTVDGGQSWQAVMHDQDSLAIGSIAIDPTNADVVYAGTGEPVYYLSGSGPLPPESGQIAWYYEGVGIYRSTDGGTTWTLTGTMENDFIYKIAVDPFDSSHLLCAGYSTTAGAGGLCRSTDSGATWTTIRTGVYTDVVFDPTNANTIYAAQHNGGVLKSSNGGTTWDPRNTGLPSTASIGRISLSIAAAASNILYAMIENDATGGLLGAYRTSTGAEAPSGWSAVTAPPVGTTFVWWCMYIAADPSDSAGSIVYAGSVNVARSEDGGATWNLVTDAYTGTRPPTHSDQHALVFSPSDGNTVFIANDGGVFRGVYSSGASSVTWTKASAGLAVTQFYDLAISSASPSMFGGGAQDNGSMISTGGLSWRHVNGGDGGHMVFHPTDPYTIYAQWQGAGIRRSADGGNTFTFANAGIGGGGIFPATVMTIDPVNPTVLFAGTSRVYRTSSSGSAWTPASDTIGPVTELSIAPSNTNVIYAGTRAGRLYRATDGGLTATSFTDITPPTGFTGRWLSGIAVHATNPNRLYLTFLGFAGGSSSDHVWRGELDPMTATWTWTQITSGLSNAPASAIVFDGVTSDLFVATDVGVFRSTDDGANWAPFEIGLPNVAVIDIALDETRRLLRCATHGRGMYQLRLDTPTPTVDIYLRDNIIDTGEVFPSPSGVPDPTQLATVVRHYKSADIKVDSDPFDPVDALLDGVEFDDPEHPYVGFGVKIEDIAGITNTDNPIRAQVNRVYVQVHNRGWDAASSVTLKVLYADAGAGLPALPTNFWSSFPGDGFDQTHWKPIGTTTITNLLPGTPQVKMFEWTPPTTVSDHCCLLAMIDSSQDPLLPQTERNVDLLTRGNKRVTHRNVHPITTTTPGGGAKSSAWSPINFHNAFPSDKHFTLKLESISDTRGGLRLILDRPVLRQALDQSRRGFRVVPIDVDMLKRMSAQARKRGEMSEYVESQLARLRDPLVLETENGLGEAVLSDVLIPAGGMISAVIGVNPEDQHGRVRDLRFEVTQYDGTELVGGSEFHLVAPPRRAHEVLRIVLHKVQILNDRDAWIFGRGELSFLAEVRIKDAPVRGRRIRIPERGAIKISDRQHGGVAALQTPLFEGYFHPGDELTLVLLATEHDVLTADDAYTRYRRVFKGPADSWIGSYGPDDEPGDPESMADWRVWYTIERV